MSAKLAEYDGYSNIVARVFVLWIALCLLIPGCRRKEETLDAPEGAARSSSPSQTMLTEMPQRKMSPLPSEQDLAAHGSVIESNAELLTYLPDNLSSVFVVNPVRFLESEIGKNISDVIDVVITQMYGGNRMQQAIFPFKLTEMKRITVCQKIAAKTPAMSPNGMPLFKSPDEIPLSFTIYEFLQPQEDVIFLTGLNFLGVNPASIIGMQPEIHGNAKVYSLLKNNADELGVICIIVFNPQCAAYFEGSRRDLEAILDDKPATGALAQRLLRVNLVKDVNGIITDEGSESEVSIMQQYYMNFIAMGLKPLPTSEEDMMKLQQELLQLPEFVKGAYAFLDLSALPGENIIQLDILAQPGQQEKVLASFEDQLSAMKVMSAMTLQGQLKSSNIGEIDKNKLTFIDSLVQQVGITAANDHIIISLAKSADFNQKVLEYTADMFNEFRQGQKIAQARTEMNPLSHALALYVKDTGRYPAWAISSPDGTPLLSWRVALLPSLGYQELYAKFNMNEPWDGPTNLPLLAEMPREYATPLAELAPGMTLYRMFGGPDSFQHEHPEGIAKPDMEFPNDTIFAIVAHPDQAVEWTRPETLAYDMNTLPQMVALPLIFLTYSGEIAVLNPPQKPFMDYFVSGKSNPEVRAAQAEQERQMQMYMQQMQQQQMQQQMNQPFPVSPQQLPPGVGTPAEQIPLPQTLPAPVEQ